jgi:hypothetical protein
LRVAVDTTGTDDINWVASNTNLPIDVSSSDTKQAKEALKGSVVFSGLNVVA